MNQLPLPSPPALSPLAAQVLALAIEHGPERVYKLAERLPDVGACELDDAMNEANCLHWIDGRYMVAPPGAEGSEI